LNFLYDDIVHADDTRA